MESASFAGFGSSPSETYFEFPMTRATFVPVVGRRGAGSLARGRETSLAQHLVVIGRRLIMVGGGRQIVRLLLAGLDRVMQRQVGAQQRQERAGEDAVGVGIRCPTADPSRPDLRPRNR